MVAPKDELKLVVIIAADADADRLIGRMVEQGYPATKIASTGGFLRRGNVTILSGVEAAEVDIILGMVRQECHARMEYLPRQMLPLLGEGGFLPTPVPVRMGGAIVFVLPVERFEKT